MKKLLAVFALVFAILATQFFGIAGLTLPSAKAADVTPIVVRDGDGNIISVSYPNDSIEDFITDLELTEVQPDETDPLGTDGNPEPQNGAFRMTYSFYIEQNSGLLDEDFFFLDLPDYVHVPVNVSNVDIYDSMFGIHVCTVHMLMASDPLNTTGEDAIRVDFTDVLEAQTINYEFIGEFWFEASFDEDAVDEGGTITMQFDNGRASSPYNRTVEFVEDPPVDPTLSKSVSSNSWNSTEHRHYQTWTLDLNSENIDLGEGVVIKDVLPLSNTELEYIGNITQTNGSATYTPNYDLATHTFTITFDEAVTERQTFTFQTAYYDDIYINHLNNSDRTINMSNSASAETSIGTIYSNAATRDYNIDVINKYDTATDISNRTITWRIEANPYDYIVNGAFVTDDLPEGLIMDESSIEFFYDDGVTVAPGSWSIADQGTPDLDDDIYTFTLGDITEEIWIEFITEIDDALYYTQNNDSFQNDAYFYPPATDSWMNRGRHTVPFTTDILQKSSSIDIASGVITWEIRINPNTTVTNPVQLEDLVVTDPIPDNITTTPASTNNGLSYIAGTLSVNPAITTEVAGALAYYDTINNQIVIDFDPDDTQDGGDVIAQEYVVTYQTQIADDYIYKINADSTVTNIASYTSNNAGNDSVSDDQSIQPDVLQKALISYDYDTHYFRWHIHVNTNGTELENALITDYISEDMLYVPGTFEINSSSGSAYTGGVFNYVEHDPVIVNPRNNTENISGTITYQFPAIITDSYDIYFETEYVDFNNLADNHLSFSADYLEAENTVYLDHDDMPSGRSVLISHTEPFLSSVIEKEPDYRSGNQYIDWVVTINKNQIDILGPNPDPYPSNIYTGPVIYDTLQEGLVIDLESITLYSAVVLSDLDANDVIQVGTTSTVSFDDAQVQYDANTRELTFEFANDINSCYVMTFRTYIGEGYNRGSFDNTASFHALAGTDNNTSDNESVLFATGGGYAAANIGHLIITKVDDLSNLPLQGARFELINASGTVVDVQETDSNGHATFEFIFFDRDYYYRESQAPYGYSADLATTTHVIINSADITTDDDVDRTLHAGPIGNTANGVTVEFYKYGPDGITGLGGAIFAIYDQVAPAIEIDRQTSNSSGYVAFTGLAANRSYNIVELSAPLGYQRYTGTLTVDVTVGGPFTPTPSSVTNSADLTALGTVQFTKYREDSITPLEDCVFGIYASSAPTLLKGTATSQADGTVTFFPVAPGVYIIRELSSPAGYEVSATELTSTVGAAPGIYPTTPSSLTNYIERVPSINPQTGDTSASTAQRLLALCIMIIFILCAGIYVHVSYTNYAKQ